MRNPEQKPNPRLSDSQSSEHRVEGFVLPSSYSNLAREIHDEIGDIFAEGVDLDRLLRQLEFFFKDYRDQPNASGTPSISSQEVHLIHALSDFAEGHDQLYLTDSLSLTPKQALSLSSVRSKIDPALIHSFSKYVDKLDSALKPLSDGISEGGVHYLMGKDFQFRESAVVHFESFLKEAQNGYTHFFPALSKETKGDITGAEFDHIIQKMNEVSNDRRSSKGKAEAVAHHQITQSLYDEFISELGHGGESQLKDKLIQLIGLNLQGMESGLAGQTLHSFAFIKEGDTSKRFLSRTAPLNQLEFLLGVMNVGMGFQHNLRLQRDLLDPKRPK